MWRALSQNEKSRFAGSRSFCSKPLPRAARARIHAVR